MAIDLNNPATLLRSTNRLTEAEPLFRRALAINEKSHGPDHPNTKAIRKNLELLLQQLTGSRKALSDMNKVENK